MTMGMARLAMAAPLCIECGLCLSGCPHGLIYASSQTLEPLVSTGAVMYHSGQMVIRVGEDADGCWIDARELSSGRLKGSVATECCLHAAGWAPRVWS